MVEDGHRRRLRSWKEIAAFFGADVRTAKRWEVARGLPVHRPPGDGRAAVFAYADELSAWLEAGGAAAEPTPAPLPFAPAPVERPTRRRGRRWPAFAWGGGGLAAAAAVLVVAARPQPEPSTARPDGADALYATGVFHLETRSREGLQLAQRYLLGAIAERPDNAPAYARLAETFEMMNQFDDLPAAEAHARAQAAAERAATLDPKNARAWAMLGFIAFHRDHDWARAGALFDRALALEPDTAAIHLWYALILMHGGDQRRPLLEITRAQQLDPGSRTILANRALILFHAGQADAAVTLLRELADSEPKLRSPPEYLATIYLAQGRWEDHLRAAETAARLTGDAGRLAEVQDAAAALAARGAPAMLRLLYGRDRDRYAAGALPAFKLAQSAALAGDRRAALALLSTAVARGEPDAVGIKLEPALRPLHGDPAFAGLVRRLGLPATPA